MTRRLSDQLLSRLSSFVGERFGLHYPDKRWRDLERCISHAARDFGFKDAAACSQWLLTATLSSEQIALLGRHLTIGETYFFREQKSLEALEGTILPALIAARRGKEQRLRIWSAGCSSGEEPYSIAILLRRLLPDLREWNVTILATDLNAQALAKAARGIYGDWSFRGTPQWLKEKYFTRSGERSFAITDAIRDMVTFAGLNLATDTYPSLLNNTNAMDIILCRNVLMYFKPERAQKVVENFRHALLPGGWLLVSPCEVSYLLFQEFETVSLPQTIFYRKYGQRSLVPNVPLRPAAIAAPPPAAELPSPPLPPPQEPPVTAPAPAPPAAPAPPSPYEEAVALCQRGDYGLAAEKLTALLAQEPAASETTSSTGKAAALLTQALANQGRLAEALHWSARTIAADKLDPQHYYLRATICQEQGEIDAAVVSLQQALYLDHDFVLAHFALGNLTRRQGKKREAGRHFTNALALLRQHPADEILPEAEGMTVGRLTAIITSMPDMAPHVDRHRRDRKG
jgi:chemotaxis protein methyltransferase CheR